MDQQNVLFELDTLFTRNPAYSTLYAETIKAAATRLPEADLCRAIDSLKTAANQTQDSASVLESLVRHGAIRRTILVDGEEYAGTAEDLRKDESLPDRIQVEYLVSATQEGLFAAEAFEQSISLEAVFAQRPQYVPGYRAVLEACMDPEGKTTEELQALLCEKGILRNDIFGQQELHTSYFTGKLEFSKALVWDRKRWRTTPKGAAMVSASH